MFKAYYTPLCSYACSFVKDMQQSEELVQECFIQIWEKGENIDIENSIKFYLFRTVKNRCLNYLKKQQRQRNTTVYLEEEIINREHFFLESIDNPERRKELQEKINSAMNLLPVSCREIFEMAKFSSMKYKEISIELDISVKTVENQMSKALKILRKELSSYY